MPRFIRVEHEETNDGPYTRAIKGWLLSDRDSTSQRPSPDEDGGSEGWYYPRKYRYAFRSTRQLLNWFSVDDILLMQEYGFVVRVVYMYDYEILGKQVVGVIRTRGKCIEL
jgi:hypothetical protein